MANNNVTLSINGKDKATPVIAQVKASTVALGVAVGNLATKGLTFLINQTRGLIDAALDSERANMMVDASLRGIGKYTPELAQKMKDLAGTIQDEIGGSDEYFADIISQLLTLGVSTDKIDQATRAVISLEAVGKGGAAAMTAIARAAEGDYQAFERLIPAVRMATTDTEKLAAINATIAAGYAQQEAKLQTVGGAWEALKGRLGDAQEAFTNAIFKGLGLSDTFGDMQTAVGNFLRSDQWNNFLEKLESSARFAKDLVTAMLSTSGFKAVGVALGDVILAALKDGADYVSEAIKNALGKQAVKDYQEKYSNDPIARAARWLGAKSGGASNEEAAAMMDRTDFAVGGDGGSTGRLEKAIESLKEVIEEQNKKTEENTEAVKENTEKPDAPKLERPDKPRADPNLDPKIKALDKQIEGAQKQKALAGLNAQIADEQKNIAEADRNINAAQKIINDKKTPAQAIAERNQEIANEKAEQEETKKIMDRYDNLKMREKAAGNLKLKLNKKDQALIDGVEAEKKRQEDAQNLLNKNAREKADAEQNIKAAKEAADKIQGDQLEELKKIRENILQSLTARS